MVHPANTQIKYIIKKNFADKYKFKAMALAAGAFLGCVWDQ
jgi:hypothetical protein